MNSMKDMLGDTPFAPAAPTPKPADMVRDIPTEVCELFEKYAWEAHDAGMKRFSADAILHRVRWHEQVEFGRGDFKCNNNWTSALARWFMARHPRLDGFFETRELKS